MNKTELIQVRINKELKKDFKKAIQKQRYPKTMSEDLLEYIKQKVRNSGVAND